LDIFHRPFQDEFTLANFQPLRSWLISNAPSEQKIKRRDEFIAPFFVPHKIICAGV
jgi:hypothetical protein